MIDIPVLGPMSSRARKSQKLTTRDSSESTKHGRASHDNEEYSIKRGSGSEISDSESSLDPDFAVLGVAEFLDLDPRPTFVVTSELDLETGFEPTYSNEALRSNYQLVKSIAQHSSTSSPPSSPKISSSLFRSWIKDSVHHGNFEDLQLPNFSFCGLVWTAFTIRERWTVISGSDANHGGRGISGHLPLRSESPNAIQPVTPVAFSTIEQPKAIQVARPRSTVPTKIQSDNHHSSFVTPGTSDWTLAHPPGDLTPHVIFARSK